MLKSPHIRRLLGLLVICTSVLLTQYFLTGAWRQQGLSTLRPCPLVDAAYEQAFAVLDVEGWFLVVPLWNLGKIRPVSHGVLLPWAKTVDIEQSIREQAVGQYMSSIDRSDRRRARLLSPSSADHT